MANKEYTRLQVVGITVEDRVRKDFGDLSELTESMREGGLVNPICVMIREDDSRLLLCGERRLRAARELGWEHIDAIVYDAMDAEEAIKLEFRENLGRKDWDDSERVAWGLKLEDVIAEKAKKNSQINLRQGDHAPDVDPEPHRESGRTRDLVAKAVGYQSGRQYARAKEVVTKRPDLAEQVKQGKASLTGAQRQLRADEGRPLSPRKSYPAPVASVPNPNRRPNAVINLPEGDEPVNVSKYGLVRQETIPISVPSAYFPTAIEAKGDPDSVKGANHEKLMTNPIYSGLFAKYQEMQLYAASLRDMLTNKLRTLRSIEQNNVDLQRRLGIDGNKGEFEQQ
ncbi:hypothetical protein AGMMS49992_19330 [Clostridia bacterium]|nr:hypothetical protein AGMMS49992_19330 [Clostridia bacterium]